MKKLVAFVLAFVCAFSLVACSADTHTCRVGDDIAKENFQSSSLSESFVTEEERNELLCKAVEEYLINRDMNAVGFTFEIIDTLLGVYESKNTILYWVHIVDGDGFSIVKCFYIQ
jgi:hypothetical protein